MAEAATGDDLQKVTDQLKQNNAESSEQANTLAEKTSKQTDIIEGAKTAVKEGSEVVSGAVSKAGDISNKTAQALQTSTNGCMEWYKGIIGVYR